MKKFIISMLIISFLFTLVTCTAAEIQPIEATRLAATAAPEESTPLPTQVGAPIVEAATTVDPTSIEPTGSDDLAVFIEQLQTAVTNQDYVAMQSLMSTPIAVGVWRSEWRLLEPTLAVEEFQNESLPAPLAVQFTNLNNDDLTSLLGQPPATMFGPESSVVAVLHSRGWGQSPRDEAILFVTEHDGRYTWSAFLYTNGRFVDANFKVAAAPVGLIYHIAADGLYQIQANGEHRQLLDAATAHIPNLQIAPDGRHAAYLNDERQLWLIDTATGTQQQLASDYDLSGFLLWGNSQTLFVGVWLNPDEAEGPNNGHITTIDIETGAVQILAEDRLSGGRPALAADGETVAFDVFTTSQDDVLNGRLYHPDIGLQIFDPTTFSGGIGHPVQNPGWSPDGNKIAWISYDGDRSILQIFDLETKTAAAPLDWNAARFGALVPSPVWSPDGQWIALEVWASNLHETGLWLVASKGSETRFIAQQGNNPRWFNETLLVFGLTNAPILYDVTTTRQRRMELPTGATYVTLTPWSELDG